MQNWACAKKRHRQINNTDMRRTVKPSLMVPKKYTEVFAPVPCRASIWSGSPKYSYHIHVTSALETPYPLLPLIISRYSRWIRSRSSRSRRWGRPDCSSSPTVAGFSLFCFVPAFLPICNRSFGQLVCFACLSVVYFGLSLSRCLS